MWYSLYSFACMKNTSLISKYNVPVPRYTSYPTVPNWKATSPSSEEWINALNKNLKEDNEISLYIHLPFCEELCTYCACNKRITKNHRVETPYIDTVLKEWSIYLDHLTKRPVIKELHLGGGTPTFFSPHELARLIRDITSEVNVSDDKIFSIEIHPNTTSEAHLKTLSTLGFSRVSIGVQDIDEFILSAINRTQTKDQIIHMTETSRRLGFKSVNYDIIYGLPFQRTDNIEKTMDFISTMMPDRLAYYSYAHVPWKSKGQRAFDDTDVPDGAKKIQLKELGHKLLEEIGYKHIGMDHYSLQSDALYKSYMNGHLHRNFMGYTEAKTRCLIGLGASSISDGHDMYVQNEKNVEEYQKRINDKELALIRGHILSDQELRIREHIVSLMCRNYTEWKGGMMEQSIMESALSRLGEKMNDELVECNDNYLKVNSKGRHFIRNICADIDPHFDNNKVRFSKSL